MPQDMGHNIKIENSDEEEIEIPLDLANLPPLKEGGVPHELKSRLFNCPDVAFIVRKTTIRMMVLELESLIERGRNPAGSLMERLSPFPHTSW